MHQPTQHHRQDPRPDPLTDRLVWGVRAVFVLGAAASLAANVLHANPNPISRTIAGWPPVALVLAVELISRIPVHRRGLATVRLIATAAIALIAAWVSYWHMAEVIRHYGETGTAPYLIPISVDGLMVVASVCLVEIGHGSRKTSPAPTPEQVSAPEVIPQPEPEQEAIPEPTPGRRRTPNPRGYVKGAAREVILSRPDATVPELVAALVDQTGTHRKHATKTVADVLKEGVPA